MKKRSFLFAILLAFSVLGMLPVAIGAEVSLQLGMLIDGSGSVTSTNFQLMLDGIASAIRDSSCITHDGSVELTVVQFSHIAEVEIAPTVIDSQATANAVADQVQAITRLDRNTNMGFGFNAITDAIINSPHFATAQKRVINLASDGDPCCDDFSVQEAIDARNNSIAAGIDGIDAEAVGIKSNIDWLRDEIVYPQPGYDTWPPPGPGWVRSVKDFGEFADTVCEKLKTVISTPIPTPTPNYLDLRVRPNSSTGWYDFYPNNQLVLEWETHEDRYGYTNVPCAVYLGVARDSLAENEPVAVIDIMQSGILLLFDSTMKPSLHIPGNVHPTFKAVPFPVPGLGSRGELSFLVPQGASGRWVFAAAFIRLDGGGFPGDPPVEVSNGFTVH